MTAAQVSDLAFQYSESIKDKSLISRGTYFDAKAWFRDHGGSKDDYSVFCDLAHMCLKNTFELRFSDAYMGFPEWIYD